MCGWLPLPQDPIDTLPGCARAKAISSPMVLTFNAGDTITSAGPVADNVTFQIVRAKLRATNDDTTDAMAATLDVAAAAAGVKVKVVRQTITQVMNKTEPA